MNNWVKLSFRKEIHKEHLFFTLTKKSLRSFKMPLANKDSVINKNKREKLFYLIL